MQHGKAWLGLLALLAIVSWGHNAIAQSRAATGQIEGLGSDRSLLSVVTKPSVGDAAFGVPDGEPGSASFAQAS